MNQELSEAISEAIADALNLLGLARVDELPPHDMVMKIKNYVSEQLDADDLSEAQRHENSLFLGALWGEQVVRAYGWQWKHLDFGKEGQGIYVVSPRAAHCCPPLYFLNKIMMGKNTGLDGQNDNMVMLLFNMLKDVPSGADQGYQVLS